MKVLQASTPLSQSIATRAKTGSSIKEVMEGRADLYKLNPFSINIENDFNVRDFNSPAVMDHIDGIARSIVEIGLLKPLKVRMKNGTPTLVDGECRLRAIIRAIEVYDAEIRTVEVKLADKSMSEAEATLSLAVENSGLDITSLEKGIVFRRLDKYGWTLADIAARAGLSVVRIAQLIELAGLSDPIKEMIKSGEIASTLALTIAKDNHFDDAKTLAAIKSGLTAAQKNGRKRCTARHVDTGKLSAKKAMAAMFQSATIDDVDEDDHCVVVSFSRENFEAIEKLLKIDLLSTFEG